MSFAFWNAIFSSAGYQQSWYSENTWFTNERTLTTTQGKYQASGEATLWGRVKPVTYGTRRIMGQLLQIGPSRLEELVRSYVTGGSTHGGGYGPFIQLTDYTDRITYLSTFAYCFGEPGNPTSRQHVKKIWIDKQLVFDAAQGQLASNFRFFFYDGNEDQFPDRELNKDRYDYPVGYRGLMYIVFYDYTTYKNPGSNPLVEAEFTEELSNVQTSVTYQDMGTPLTTNFQRQCGYDPKKNFLYQVGQTDGIIYKFDCTLQQLVDSYPVTGAVYQGKLGGSLGPLEINGSLRLENVFYLIGSMASGNSRQIFLVDANTGVVVDDFGQNTSSLTPSLTNVVAPNTVMSLTSTDGYSISGHFVLTDVFGNFYLFKISNGEMTMLDFENILDSGGFPFTAISAESGNIVLYHAHDEKIGRWLKGNYTDDWYTGTYEVQHIVPLLRDGTLVIFETSLDANSWKISKIRTSDKSVVWSIGHADYPTAEPPDGFVNEWRSQSYTAQQKIGWMTLGANKMQLLDMISGQLFVVSYSNPNYDMPVYDAYTNQFIQRINVGGTSGSVRAVPVFSPTSSSITLESLLRDLARRAGYENSNVTVQGLSDTITGAVFTEIASIDTILGEIATAYNFEIIKRGPKISFIRRGYGDLFDPDMISVEATRAILSDSDDEYITVRSERAPIQKSAGSIRLTFIDPSYDYAVNEYKYSRNDSQSDPSITVTIALPIIMTASQAATLATRTLLNDGVARMQHELRLPQANLALEKGDVIELVTDEFTDYVRVDEISYNGDFSMSLRTSAILTSATSPVTVPPPVIPVEPPALTDGAAQVLIFDTPLLDYTHQQGANVLEVYLGIIPATRTPVSVGQLVKFYQEAGPAASGNLTEELVYGSLRGNLSSGPVLQVLYDEIIQLRLVQGEAADFETSTVLDMLAGANRILVGQPGRWEMIGFVQADYEPSTKIITLTDIVRGLRGTDWAAATHQVGDLVVLYDSTLQSMIIDTENVDKLNDPVVYVSVKASGKMDREETSGYFVNGNARKPWRPYNVHVVNDAGDLDITWERRTRLNGPLLNGTGDVPLDETAELYDLVIYRSGNVVRTVTGLTSPTFTYTTSMQSTDGWSGSIIQLQLDVYQISSLVGRGFPMSGAFDVE